MTPKAQALTGSVRQIILEHSGRLVASCPQLERPAAVKVQLLAVASVLVVACAGDSAKDWAGTIDTLPSGVIHVSNPEEGLWDTSPLWQLTEVSKIGTRHGSGPAMFGMVWDIEVDQAGRVYVFDWQAQDVRLFEADGSYVRTIGRPGGGPGEFRHVNGIAVDLANRLWVNDQGNLRLSVFDSSGGLVMEPHKSGTGIGFVYWRSVFSADGHLIEYGGYNTAEGRFFGLRRYDVATERLVDVNVSPAVPAPPGTRPFSKIRTLTRRGFWGGDKYTYWLSHTTFSGDTVRIVEGARESNRLSASERDSAEQNERQLRRRATQRDLDLETELRPVFETLVLDDSDHLWVMLSAEPEQERSRFDVFDPIGRYLGQLLAPHLVEPQPLPVFRDGRIYYVRKDELDVQYVVVAEIRGRR